MHDDDRRRPLNPSPSQHRFKELEQLFPSVPGSFILKVLQDFAGEDNVFSALDQESKKISQTDSPDWVKDYYKAFECRNAESCSNQFCLYYHSRSERRRVYKYQAYAETMCKELQCTDDCVNSHTVNEVLYHPSVYRSKICPFFLSTHRCVNERLCPFAHQENEIGQTFEEFIKLHEELDQVARAVAEAEEEVKVKLLMEEEYQHKFRCVCGKDKDYVRTPCGHGACEKCYMLPNCRNCKSKSEAFKIN
jgi:hypothetical protein